jgi:hypothetical protein
MLGRSMKGGCLVALVVLAACSDQSKEAPTGPQFKPGGGSSTSCDFNSLQSLIVGYFPNAQQSGISGLKNSMASEADAAARRALGYQIMDSIGKTSRTVSLSSSALTAGTNLTKGLIKCMFDASITSEFPGFPDSSLYSFDLALNAPAGGAYYVRRKTSGTSPVLSVQTTVFPQNTLSGVAPPLGSTWDDVLDETALIYGWFIPASNEFEWATIRPNVIFDPEAVIALCVGNVPENTLVFESNIGFLAWQGDGGDICGATYTPALTMLESGWGPGSLARRATHWGRRLLLPEPAFAAALALGGTGTAKTLKSKLKLDAVSGAITLAVDIPPGGVEKDSVEFTVRVRATDSEGAGVNGLCVVGEGFANNGGPAELQGPSNCDTPGPKRLAQLTETVFLGPGNSNPEAGYATFHITIPSPGGINIAFSGFDSPEVDDNLSAPVTGTSTGKFNIKP